jgi:uncharacterized protein (DUF433 family)
MYGRIGLSQWGGRRMAKRDLDKIRRTPAYPFVEAAHYLNLPVSTLRAWCLGQDYAPDRKTKRFVPLIKLDGERGQGLSFLNLVEAHVLAAIRRKYAIPLPKVREALSYVSRKLGVGRPLADVTFQTDGVGLFVEELGRLINVVKDGQVEMAHLLRAYLHRIERDPEHVPIKLFPFTRTDDMADAPAPIEIDPTIAFGRPVIRGRAVPTAVLADRFKAGDSILVIAEDMEISSDVIEDAIRCELERAAA